MVDKPEGKGKGRWTAAGVQAQQAADIEVLSDILRDLLERVEELEAANDGGDTGGDV